MLPREEVWGCLSDPAWHKPTFKNVSDGALELLFLTFSLVLNANDKKLKAQLPHIYANACEDSVDDAERRQALFVFTAISGVHTYSVSALQRLLASGDRATYLELLSELRNSWLSDRNYPRWLIARIRAVLAVTTAI